MGYVQIFKVIKAKAQFCDVTRMTLNFYRVFGANGGDCFR